MSGVCTECTEYCSQSPHGCPGQLSPAMVGSRPGGARGLLRAGCRTGQPGSVGKQGGRSHMARSSKFSRSPFVALLLVGFAGVAAQEPGSVARPAQSATAHGRSAAANHRHAGVASAMGRSEQEAPDPRTLPLSSRQRPEVGRRRTLSRPCRLQKPSARLSRLSQSQDAGTGRSQ